MSQARHVLGISGGKDSAALAIYLSKKFPSLEMTYYFCDTGKELQETTDLVDRLENYLGKPIQRLVAEEAKKNSSDDPFDHFLKMYRGYLPSSTARWCTKKLKLEPFEQFVGDIPTVSYVGIRNDENREGYISRKKTIQSIFPFRRNIWSEDVTKSLLVPENSELILERYRSHLTGNRLDRVAAIIKEDYSNKLQKVNDLLDQGVVEFNRVVFDWLKSTEYPLALEEDFPLLEKEEGLVREDIFRLLRESGVGVPKYYEKLGYEVGERQGEYSRSRSGCYFCFFQQKIEWVWLYEQHPDLFKKAMEYEDQEKGFTWDQNESLKDLIDPRRIDAIKEEHAKRQTRSKGNVSSALINILEDDENNCVSCFV